MSFNLSYVYLSKKTILLSDNFVIFISAYIFVSKNMHTRNFLQTVTYPVAINS